MDATRSNTQITVAEDTMSSPLLDTTFYWQSGPAPSDEYEEWATADGKPWHRKRASQPVT